MRTRAVLIALLAVVLVAGCQVAAKPSVTPISTADPSGTHAASPKRAPVTQSVATLVGVDPVSDLRYVAVDDLPPQAGVTIGLIESDGPFEYSQDGSIFDNREGILPDRPSGYYHEYTVETPGSQDRGARRIVAGADGEMYYTSDHYSTFERIRQ